MSSLHSLINTNQGEVTMNILEKIYAHERDLIAIKYLKNTDEITNITYDILVKNIEAASQRLLEKGVLKGNRVVLFGAKSIEYLIAFFAIVGVGATAVPIFSSTGKASLLDKLDNCFPSLILCDENLIETLSVFTKDVNDIKVDSFSKFESTFFNGDSGNFVYPVQVDENSIMSIHYTSGTTSASAKGVVHSHKNYLRSIDTLDSVFDVQEDDVYWCTADFAWITGTVYGIVAPLCKGLTIVLNQNAPLSLDVLKNHIESTKTTILYTAPTLLRYIMKGFIPEKTKRNNLKRIYSVGEPLKIDVITWVKKNLDVEIYDTWFQSETGSIIIANKSNDNIAAGSMGKALDDVIVEIIDSKGDIALPNQIGSLCLKKNWPSMFLNYYHKNDLYQSKFKMGWYYTGDLAYKDENGHFWYFSREDDIINTAGHLVSPLEIEKAINEINGIKECVVFSEQDVLLGDRIVCLLSIEENVDVKKMERTIKMKVRGDVSTYAVPQVFSYVDSIPKTSSGKLIRRRL